MAHPASVPGARALLQPDTAPGPGLVDLHLHTTASDGTCGPAELVRRLARAGIRAFSVTDHDTVDALADVAALARQEGLEVVTGIEISAMRDGRDVHVLGYGFDPASARLQAFLRDQRADRVDRVGRMAARLADLGAPVDVGPLLERALHHPGCSIGRPQVARALVQAGHAVSVQAAFDRYLASGRPAHVPRRVVSPAEVVSVIMDAHGIASLAHPGLLGRDAWIAEFAGVGLAAIEAHHYDHDDAATARYRVLAAGLGLAVSGGSDDHGEASGRPSAIGWVSLPAEDYERLLARAREAGCSRVPSRPRRA